MKIKDKFRKFINDEDGLAVWEYLLILGVIAVIIYWISPSIRNAINGWFSSLMSSINSGLTDNEMGFICPDGSESSTGDASGC